MLIIRLTRIGKKNAPRYRVVLTEKTSAPKSGSFLEILGHYNPRQTKEEDGKIKKEIKLDAERIKYWLSQGAQVSATVHNLLVSEKVIEGGKIKKKIKSQKNEKEEKPSSAEAPEAGMAKEETAKKETEEEGVKTTEDVNLSQPAMEKVEEVETSEKESEK